MKKLNFKNETRVVCPKCGTEFEIAEKTHVATGVVIGKDSNLGTISPQVAKGKAADRIEALRNAGVDVSGLFSMTGANGGDFVVRNEGGKISILADDDPIFNNIIEEGAVPNSKLFRRWVMAQEFRMLYEEQKPSTRYWRSITEQIRCKGYDYMWKQMRDEFWAQYKMRKNGDMENYNDRNRWFNWQIVLYALQDYLRQLKSHVRNLEVKRCKGVPYKNICGDNVFVSDIERKVYAPVMDLLSKAETKSTAFELWTILCDFEKIRKTRRWNPSQCREWLDAYKGSGAFFTMQNMIRFHKCTAIDDNGRRLDKNESYAFLQAKAKEYEVEGWRMVGLLRKFLEDNNINIEQKRKEWMKRK